MMRLGRPESPQSEEKKAPPANSTQPEKESPEQEPKEGKSLMDWIKTIWQKKK